MADDNVTPLPTAAKNPVVNEHPEITTLGVVTTLQMPASSILRNINDLNIVDSLVVVGWDNDGDLFFAANYSDGGDAILLLELAKRKLLDLISPPNER